VTRKEKKKGKGFNKPSRVLNSNFLEGERGERQWEIEKGLHNNGTLILALGRVTRMGEAQKGDRGKGKRRTETFVLADASRRAPR